MGLLALAIPIAIHLWSKKKVQTIKVGSIQFISDTKSQQQNNIAINEWLLLVTRCLLIGLLVCILAQPRFDKSRSRETITYLFEPSLLSDEDAIARFSNIPEGKRRLFTAGFPLWEESEEIPPPTEISHYWQLAQQLSTLQSDSIVVFTKALQSGIKGKRPDVQTHVNWVVIPSESELEEIVQAVDMGDTVQFTILRSNGFESAFAKAYKNKSNLQAQINTTGDSIKVQSNNREKWIALEEQEIYKAQLIYEEAYDSQRVFIEASLRAIAEYTNKKIEITRATPDNYDHTKNADYLVWLSDSEVPQSKAKTLIRAVDELSVKSIVSLPEATTSSLTKVLTSKSITEGDFTSELLQWLDFDKQVKRDAMIYDQRSMDIAQLEPNVTLGKKKIQQSEQVSFDHWLWILLVILLIGERFIARLRKQ